MKLRTILSILLLTAFISFPALAMRDMEDRMRDGKMMRKERMHKKRMMHRDNDKMHMSFEQKKARKVKKIGKYISLMQKKKSCIKASKNREAYKECKKDFRAKKKAMKTKYKKHKKYKKNLGFN